MEKKTVCKVLPPTSKVPSDQDGNKVVLHQKLALKKRVYEAGDWNGFRNAVNAHKSFGDYIVIKR